MQTINNSYVASRLSLLTLLLIAFPAAGHCLLQQPIVANRPQQHRQWWPIANDNNDQLFSVITTGDQLQQWMATATRSHKKPHWPPATGDGDSDLQLIEKAKISTDSSNKRQCQVATTIGSDLQPAATVTHSDWWSATAMNCHQQWQIATSSD